GGRGPAVREHLRARREEPVGSDSRGRNASARFPQLAPNAARREGDGRAGDRDDSDGSHRRRHGRSEAEASRAPALIGSPTNRWFLERGRGAGGNTTGFLPSPA